MRTVCRHPTQALVEIRQRLELDESRKALAEQPGARLPQHAGAGQVGLLDVAVRSQREIADGSEIVEFVVVRLEFRPGLAQFLVLKLQLDLVDLKLVDQPARVPTAYRSRAFAMLSHALFGAAAKIGRFGFRFVFSRRPGTRLHGSLPNFTCCVP